MPDLIYPLSVANGKLAVTDSYDRLARQHIIHALDTKLEELLMLPEYGSPVAAFISVPDLPQFLAQVEVSIKLSLTQFEDVFIQALGEFTDDGLLSLQIAYSIDDVGQLSIDRLLQLGYG